MMVRPINENDFDRRFSKSVCRSQTTETSSDNHHAWRLRRPLIRTIDRIEISIVHPSVSQAFEVRNFRESTESWIAAGADGDDQISPANGCSHVNCRPSL